MSPKKPTLAVLNLTGCTGCVISILDLHEEILEVLEKVDLIYCTTILDIKEIPSCDIALINGTISNEHDIEIVKEAEKKIEKIIALGSCACFGGIAGLRNYFKSEKVLECAYELAPTNDAGLIPSKDIPPLTEYVEVLESEIRIDYKIPGCPPLPSMIKTTLIDILDGKEPIIPTRNLCAECDKIHESMLNPTKEFITFRVNAPYEIDYREDLCFLEQGILCIGFATREGCKGRCVKANLPCRGCMGPLEKEKDQGCASITGLSSIFPIGQLIKQEDLSGTVYRYSLPFSILHEVHKKQKGGKNGD
ncbi:MAG: F420-nonreducing hydrogenase [Promethearchaeota archaeon]